MNDEQIDLYATRLTESAEFLDAAVQAAILNKQFTAEQARNLHEHLECATRTLIDINRKLTDHIFALYVLRTKDYNALQNNASSTRRVRPW